MKIIIDPGHGGTDPGAVGNGIYESDVVLDVSLKVGNLLEKQGINIIYTRIDDKKITLDERTSLANLQNADYFISIHANSGGGTGTETLIYKNGSTAESLAKVVQKYIVDTLSLKDRGVKVRSDLWVLKRTIMPAILIELAFVDNVNDSKLLKDSLDKFALAIANGVLTFLGKEEIVLSKYIDVPTSHWAKDIIEEVTDLGIMQGFTDNSFKPDEPLTRAQAAIIIKNVINYLKKN